MAHGTAVELSNQHLHTPRRIQSADLVNRVHGVSHLRHLARLYCLFLIKHWFNPATI